MGTKWGNQVLRLCFGLRRRAKHGISAPQVDAGPKLAM